MRTQARSKNAIPEFLDFRMQLKIVEAVPGRVGVYSELRIQPTEIDEDEGPPFRLSARLVSLSLHCEGYVVSAGSQLGDPVRGSVRTKITETLENVSSAAASAKLGVSAQGLAGETNFTADGSVQQRRISESVVEDTYLYVKARPNDRWEISEYNGNLDGTYLSNSMICEVDSISGSNRQSISAHIFAKQKDVIVEPSRDHPASRLTQTRKKMWEILVKKSLNQRESFGGIVVFSSAEFSDD